jgi:hypothetical protein
MLVVLLVVRLLMPLGMVLVISASKKKGKGQRRLVYVATAEAPRDYSRSSQKINEAYYK